MKTCLGLLLSVVLIFSAGQALCEEIFDLSVFDADVEILGSPGSRLGLVVCGGDINGDGIDDMVVAEEYGPVHIVYGDTSISRFIDLSSDSADVTIHGIGAFATTYSSPAASFGDLNGDHIQDLIILNGYYEAYVVYGDISLPSVIDVGSYPGAMALPFPAGLSTAIGAGDFNQDGFDDPMMPTFWSSEDGVQAFASYGGESWMDAAGQLTTSWDVRIKVTDCGSISCPSTCPTDINNDGFDDIVFSSIKYYGPGSQGDYSGGVWAIYGAETLPSWINLDSTAAGLSIYGPGGSLGGYFGAGIGTGDINGDGFNDLIVGAPRGYGLDAGKAYVLYGDTLLPEVVDLRDTTADVYIYGLDSLFLGNTITTGDFNGDEYADMLSCGGHRGSDPVGKVVAVFGGESLASELYLESGFEGIVIIGERQPYYLGSDIAMGDFNGDELCDLLIGASGHSVEMPAMVYVVFGSNTINYGDANYDKLIDLADAVFLLNYLFKSGPQPYPLLAGDTNCDEVVDVADVVCLLNYLFKNGSEPGCP